MRRIAELRKLFTGGNDRHEWQDVWRNSFSVVEAHEPAFPILCGRGFPSRSDPVSELRSTFDLIIGRPPPKLDLNIARPCRHLRFQRLQPRARAFLERIRDVDGVQREIVR